MQTTDLIISLTKPSLRNNALAGSTSTLVHCLHEAGIDGKQIVRVIEEMLAYGLLVAELDHLTAGQRKRVGEELGVVREVFGLTAPEVAKSVAFTDDE